MKKVISLLLAMVLVSACGTAPHADVSVESAPGSEEEQGHELTYYIVGGAVAVLAACTIVPGASRMCQKQLMSADKFKAKLTKQIDELKERVANLAKADGDNDSKIKRAESKIEKLKELESNVGDKNGIFFVAYDSTIGKLVRRFKKSDDAAEATDGSKKNAEEGTEPEGKTGQSDDGKQPTDNEPEGTGDGTQSQGDGNTQTTGNKQEGTGDGTQSQGGQQGDGGKPGSEQQTADNSGGQTTDNKQGSTEKK